MPDQPPPLLTEDDQQELVRALTGGRWDAAVGFGLELGLVTRVVLAVATPVVQFLASLLAELGLSDERQEAAVVRYNSRVTAVQELAGSA